jgi:hypothetical protein
VRTPRKRRLRGEDEARLACQYYSQNPENGNRLGGKKPERYKKGEGALPCISFMIERRSDLPLVLYRPTIRIAFIRPSSADIGRDKRISNYLVSEIFFAVVKIALHAFVQLAGEIALFGAVT